MKARKKLLALFLALCMTASLAACGGGSDTSSGTESGSSETSEAVSQGETGSGNESSDEVTTLSIYINHSWYGVEKFEGIIPEAITEATGVVLDPTVAVDQSQLGVMIASGELPDLVYTQELLDRMSDASVSYAYDDLIEEYNVDWEIPETQQGIAKGYSKDGKVYTILNHYFNRDHYRLGSDYTMYREAFQLMNSEIAILVYPRRLYLQIGEGDPLLPAEGGRAEYSRLKRYAQRTQEDWLHFTVFPGEHEFWEEDGPLSQLMEDLGARP